jgi:protein-S-isoprenylcysteine O-methyltransferase Ste14
MNSNIGPTINKFPINGSFLQLLGWVGILISAYNIRTVLTAEPLPRKNGKLSTDGLYRYVRHPMYTSVMVLSAGIAVSSGSLIKYALVIGLAVLFHFKSNYEEHYLAEQYPEYTNYAKKTPRFVPFTKPK